MSLLVSFPVLGCHHHVEQCARRLCFCKAACLVQTELPVMSAEHPDPKCGDAAMWSQTAGFHAGY